MPLGASPVEDQRAEVQRITDGLEELERRSDLLAEEFVVASAELDAVREAVATSERRVAEKSAEVDALREELARVAVQTYTRAGSPSMNPLFVDHRSTTDALQRDQLARVALDTGTATTDELDAAVSDLDDERRRLADDQAAAEQALDDQTDAREANEAERARYQEARREAEAELGQLLAEEEERRARESYERMQRAAEEAAAAARAASQPARPAAARTSPASPAAQAPSAPRTPAAAAPAPAPASPPVTSPPSPPGPAAPPPSSSRASVAIAAAMSQLGVPYVAYSSQPGVGFDCSGLTGWAWAQAGVSLPRNSGMQAAALPKVPIGDAQPGDLLFYYSPISHVGIYLGGGQIIHAPNTGSVVNIATVRWERVVGVGRPG